MKQQKRSRHKRPKVSCKNRGYIKDSIYVGWYEKFKLWMEKPLGDRITDAALYILDLMVLGVYLFAAKCALLTVLLLGTTSWMNIVLTISRSCNGSPTCDVDWSGLAIAGDVFVIGFVAIGVGVWWYIFMEKGVGMIKYLNGERNGKTDN